MDEVLEAEEWNDIAHDEYIIPYLMENVAMANSMSLGNYVGNLNFRNFIKGDKSKILADLHFENLVNYSISRKKWAIHRYTNMEEYLQDIIGLIKSEFGDNVTIR